jgi:hypothetical protein
MQVDISIINIPRFDRNFFESDEFFCAIGNGKLGGKASGLVFINQILKDKINPNEFPSVNIFLPRMVVLCTDIFDTFINENNLLDFALNEDSDIRIINRFLHADLPAAILGDIHALIEKVNVPLAIRSSSLLEDTKHEPLAGVYSTKMIPNNQPSFDTRFRKLTEAIKFVFASTYFKSSKEYFKSTSHSIEEEKMAVIIQQLVGKNHNNRFYPNVSGVARSYNFYPSGRAKPEQGVINLALGLGKTIVDGGISWSYSPSFPKTPVPFNDPEDILNNTQKYFWAVNLNLVITYDPTKETEFMNLHDLKEAEYDNTLKNIASTFDTNSNKIILGTHIEGPRIIDFAPILKTDEFGFNELIKKIISVCDEGMKSPVEIEFAATFNKEYSRMNFGFLQVRPLSVSDEIVELVDEKFEQNNILVASDRVMGNGITNDIYDIVFVKQEKFEKKETKKIAAEIEAMNKKLVDEKRRYLLIGFGRWGSCDPWLGIPVEWQQISGAEVIVESTLYNMNVELSQGSHFFHNLTGFNVKYFSINYDGEFKIDWPWLNKQNVLEEKEFVKHIRMSKSLLIKVDGRKGSGVIWKSVPSEKK